MKENEAKNLKQGDVVFNGTTIKGVVDLTMTEGNYVRIVWWDRSRVDILSRTSPLWTFLDLKKK